MKNSATRVILEKIGELGFVTLDAFFPKKYTRALPARNLFGLDSAPKISPQTFSSILSRLKRQGIVAREKRNNKKGWILTAKGEKFMGGAYRKEEKNIPPRDGVQRIVVFDIPERERRKRDVLRFELISSGFEQLQKSVWIADRPMTEEFIALLDNLRLHSHVHIFTVQKHGTLQNKH